MQNFKKIETEGFVIIENVYNENEIEKTDNNN